MHGQAQDTLEIKIDTTELSETTKMLLLRFQVAHLHRLMWDMFHDIPGEAEWLSEYKNVRKMFVDCPEPQIAEVGKVIETGFDDSPIVTDIENALHRLSLKVADKRPTFFKQVN